MHNTNKKAFSLVMAMGLVILITLLAFLILEYIIPFGRNVKGIENASKAYYEAASGIEQALLAQQQPGLLPASTNHNGSALSHRYDIVGSGALLPPLGKGNSEYDLDWNIIAPGQPIQLEIGNGLLGSNPSIELRVQVPDIAGGITGTLSGATIPISRSLPIINWQLSSKDELLSATGSWINASEINTTSGNDIDLDAKLGITLEGDELNLRSFYLGSSISPVLAGCNESDEPCTLKLSIVNPLILNGNTNLFSEGTKIPYLEWQLSFSEPVPLRYAGIKSEGKSFGFKKDINVRIPQQTVIEAFDFTVFQ